MPAEQKRHLVRTETTPMGVKQSYDYDGCGNCRLGRMESADLRIGGRTEYDANGSCAVKSFDARGSAVTKTIDPLSRLVYNGNDPTGQQVKYEYGARGRKTTVRVGGQELSTSIYAEDRDGLLQEVRYGNEGSVACEYIIGTRQVISCGRII